MAIERKSTVKISGRVWEVDDLLKFLRKRYEIADEDVLCIQYLKRDTVLVTLKKTEMALSVLKDTVITVAGGGEFMLSPPDAERRFVHVRYLPHEVPGGEIVAVLRQYGEVYHIRRSSHVNHPKVFDGSRSVLMSISQQIPSYIDVCGYRASIAYSGQERTCRLCIETGHLARECQKVQCFRCKKTGHISKNCSLPGTPWKPLMIDDKEREEDEEEQEQLKKSWEERMQEDEERMQEDEDKRVDMQEKEEQETEPDWTIVRDKRKKEEKRTEKRPNIQAKEEIVQVKLKHMRKEQEQKRDEWQLKKKKDDRARDPQQGDKVRISKNGVLESYWSYYGLCKRCGDTHDTQHCTGKEQAMQITFSSLQRDGILQSWWKEHGLCINCGGRDHGKRACPDSSR